MLAGDETSDREEETFVTRPVTKSGTGLTIHPFSSGRKNHRELERCHRPERPGTKMSTSSSLMRRSLTLSTHLTLDKTNTVITCLTHVNINLPSVFTTSSWLILATDASCDVTGPIGILWAAWRKSQWIWEIWYASSGHWQGQWVMMISNWIRS